MTYSEAAEAQTEEARRKGGLSQLLSTGSDAELVAFVEAHPGCLGWLDPIGAPAMAFLALMGRKDLYRRLMRTRHGAPFVAAQYAEGPYEGENALHIAVVQEDLAFAACLVEAAPELLGHKATGFFFSHKGAVGEKGAVSEGRCYYGELPLSFAVATNQAS